MAHVTRVFDSPGRAQAALDELKAQGFSNAELVPGPNGQGGTTLRLEPAFGTGLRAEEILNRHARSGPPSGRSAAAAKPAVAEAPPTVSPAAARSAPPEATAKPTPPHRNGSHEGVRTGPRTLSQLLGIPELIDSDTFFSGFPLLIRPSPKRTEERTKRT
ncbi:hypothetical protein [Rhodopseudomonas telluris]|uniref:SPOR domain-containing protein n=1 Tax=Rhodopseudomonas telluris TaxID=644215 RepID=A0ABV6EL88_9BRAD